MLINGTNAADTLNGTGGADLINAGNGNDVVDGGAGNDIIEGGNGNDTLLGGLGNDVLDGGNGNDSLNGGSGVDVLLGGNGNDTLDAGSGTDLVVAGSGNDVVIHAAAENTGSYDVYDGGSGQDTLRIVVTTAINGSAAFQADVAAFQAKLLHGSASHYFSSLNILATSFERLEIVISDGGNQAPTDIVLSNAAVDENSAAGTVVGNLSAVDPNNNASAFSLIAGTDRFEIVGNELRVRAGAGLDHETAPTQTVTIRVTDSGGLSFDKTFTINVGNVNEAPTAITLISTAVAENAAGALIGTLSTSDPDSGDVHSYTVSDARFEVVGDLLRLKDGISLDHEAGSSISIEITSTDAGGLTRTQTFTIDVENVNEAPTTITLSNTFVNEESAGATVGYLTFADPDIVDTPSLTVDDDRFEIDGNELKLKDGVALDFEQSAEVQLTVTATDVGGLSVSQAFTIAVNDGSEGSGVDGYIAGATVFADANNDGILQAGEATTTTDANGLFTLFGGSGALVLTGGTDIATGQAFTGTLRAPAGSSVVTPLTTLVASLVDSGSSVTDANAQVLQALGLSPAVDLAQFDPIAATLSSDLATQVAGAAVFAAAIQVQNTIAQATAVLSGAGADDAAAAIASVVDALAAEIAARAAAGETVDLGSAAVIAEVINSSALSVAGVDTDTVELVADQAATVITATNVLVQNTTTTGVDLLTGLSQVAAIAQHDASLSFLNATEQAGLDNLGAIADTVSNFTGSNLDIAVASAPVGDVDGANSSDTITGTAGADTLYGYGGDDTIFGLAGNDTLIGGDGDDTLDGGGGNNVVHGGAGNDLLIQAPSLGPSDGGRAEYTDATAAITVFLGSTATVTGDSSVGTDTLQRVEWVVGSDFADSFTATLGFVSGDGSPYNEFEGRGGDDMISGNGQTRVGYRTAAAAVTVDLIDGEGRSTVGDDAGVGIDTFTGVNQVRGSAFDDTLLGSDLGNSESFRGQAGNDFIDGRGGLQDRADYRNSPGGITAVMGGSGIGTGTVQDGFGFTDTLAGIEQIRGSEFGDSITGDAGNNRLEGRAGNDTMSGGAGDDTFDGGDGDDTLIGGSGFNVFIGAAGDDTLVGGNGVSTRDGNQADYTSSTGAVMVSMSATSSVTGDASVGNDTLQNIEWVIGSSFADSLTATGSVSNQYGNFMEFEGGGGNDTITGNGNTRVSYRFASEAVTVDLNAGTGQTTSGNAANVGFDTFSGVNQIRGSNFADTLLGSDGAELESFRGQGGNDFIDGRGGLQDRADYLNSNNGIVADLVTGQIQDGMGGTDTVQNIEFVRGSQQNDQITGDAGNNRLEGEAGNDTMSGGAGDDTLIGGAGSDTFVFATGDSADVVNDLSVSSLDTIDLTGVAGLDTFAQVQSLMSQAGADVLIDFGSGDTILVKNVLVGDLVESAFLV